MGIVIVFTILVLLYISSFVALQGKSIILKEIFFLSTGYLAGIVVRDIIHVREVYPLSLFLAVASGYFLVIFGLQFSLELLKKIPAVSLLIAFIEAGVIFILTLAAGIFFFRDLNLDLHMALVASSSASPLLVYASKKLDTRTLYALYLDPLFALSIIFVISIFQGIYMIYVLLSCLYLILVIFASSSLIFKKVEMNLFLVGGITLITGLSLVFRIEPVVPAFITGVLIANLGVKYRKNFMELLSGMEKNIYLAFLVLVGFFVKAVFNTEIITGILIISFLRCVIKFLLFRTFYAVIPGPIVLAIGSGLYMLTRRADYLFYFTLFYVINHLFLLKRSVI